MDFEITLVARNHENNVTDFELEDIRTGTWNFYTKK